MADFNILNLSDTYKWNKYLHMLPIKQQDIYFTPEYYELSENNGEGKALCFVFKKDGNIALYPFLKNNINNLGYDLDKEYYDIQGAYGYNGIISSTYNEDFIESFYKTFNEFCCDENIIAEFIRSHSLLENHKFSNNYINQELNRITVYLDLQCEYSEIWKNSFSSNNRNMIRKAQKNNIEIKILNTDNDYYNFNNIYINTMDNVNASNYYYFNNQYFKNYKNLLKNNQKLFAAFYNEINICSLLLMIYGDYCHYHLSARIKQYSNLGANNLILDSAIKYGKLNNCKYFHFGGGSSIDGSDSLFKFKSDFSKKTKEFYIGGKVHNINIYSAIINQWETKYPEKKDIYKNIFLKYRF